MRIIPANLYVGVFQRGEDGRSPSAGLSIITWYKQGSVATGGKYNTPYSRY